MLVNVEKEKSPVTSGYLIDRLRTVVFYRGDFAPVSLPPPIPATSGDIFWLSQLGKGVPPASCGQRPGMLTFYNTMDSPPE